MLTIVHLDAISRLRDLRQLAVSTGLALALAVGALAATAAQAHEGHDEDQAPPLNLPIAPRVIAVSPDFELVGVLSGVDRLTVFVTRFDTNEPVEGAKLSISAGDHEIYTVAKDGSIFEGSAPWLAATEPIDIVFKLTLPDNEDLLTGRLERTVATVSSPPNISFAQEHWLLISVGALVAGGLLTWLGAGTIPWRNRAAPLGPRAGMTPSADPNTRMKHQRGAPIAVAVIVLVGSLIDVVRSQAQISLPSVPATMATDAPQRMPDGTLFVPKATQHLLAVRTILTKESQAPRTIRLVGTVIADPNSFGRVQSGHTGRIEAPQGGLAFIGKRVEKGDLLAYLQHHIEAYNKGNLQGEIAELEARIVVQESKLALYRKHPEVIPAVKIVETEGELRALRQKRNELLPTLAEREEIRAPISGIISAGNIVTGQVVDAREVLFEIVDPGRFWVEAIAHDPRVVSNLKKASAILSSGETLPLEFAGAGLALKQQAAPLIFRVAQPSPNLNIGRPVTVILQSTDEDTGIVLPASSVVRSQSGLPAVWIKTDPERFEPRTVRFEPLDGQRVVVSAGLAADMRVVTEGATLLNQIR